ncbi:MAG: hypothetical protein LBE39_11845 [Flavobacteriaceae bacterium]|jgi:hypothetical protein|nr:hypothetical protein [Flavobacteriaceae bacterium]
MKTKNRITVIGIVLLLTGIGCNEPVKNKVKKTATSILPAYGEEDFKFGAVVQPKMTTMADYIKILANQIKRYNLIAPELWVDNININRSAIVEDLQTKEMWLIKPNGSYSTLSRDELKGYTVDYDNTKSGFGLFSGKGLKGIYLAADEQELINYNIWQKYPHLGTYDLFITFAHEQFHMVTQENWGKPNVIPNLDRDEAENDSKARAKRLLLIEQLMDAVSYPGNEDKIKAAVATYKDYQTKYPADYENSTYFDNIEGTAYYYEIKASLYAAYPKIINSKADISRALSVILANHHLPYLANGLVTEGYNIGAFAGFILDQSGDTSWQKTVVSGTVNPMQLLVKRYDGQTLPAPHKELSDDEYKKTVNQLQNLLMGK